MASTDKCYFPNGDEYTTGQPCNSTADGRVSVCCELSSSVCTTSGLCFGSAGYLYRGGCTDRSWTSPQCGQQCVDTRIDNFANVYFCEPGVFDPPRTVCCGGDSNCCASNFSLNPGVPFFPTLDLEETTSSAIPSASATESSTPTASLSSSSSTASCASNGTNVCPVVADGPSASVVGGAVGGSMAALLVAALIFLFFRERSWKRQMAGIQGQNQQMATQQMVNQQYSAQPYPAQQYPASAQMASPEDWRWKSLPAYGTDVSSPHTAHELPNEVGELDGRVVRDQ